MENKEKNMITIPLEEYKELLMIKGKYEELKSSQLKMYPSNSKITYRGPDGIEISSPTIPYKVTC